MSKIEITKNTTKLNMPDLMVLGFSDGCWPRCATASLAHWMTLHGASPATCRCTFEVMPNKKDNKPSKSIIYNTSIELCQ